MNTTEHADHYPGEHRYDCAGCRPSDEPLALGAKCAGCGHDTGKHPSAEHATAHIASSNGRYAPECLGREGNAINAFGPIACRCRATREEVSASADLSTTPESARS